MQRMKKSPKKLAKLAKDMKNALEIEEYVLLGRGYLIGAKAIKEYLRTADEQSLVTFANALNEAAKKRNQS